jgi:hypothetical protein
MSAPDDLAWYFYIQTFAVDRPRHLALLPPGRISIKATPLGSA